VLLRATAPRRARTWVVAAAAGVALAITLPFVPRWLPWSIPVHGLLAASLLMAATAGVVGALARARVGLPLAALVVGLTLFHVVVARWVAPSFDPVLSPRHQAERLRAWADAGWAPLVYRVYRGAYAYHAGRAFPETSDPAVLAEHLHASPKVVIALPESRFRHLGGLADGLVVVDRQLIEGRPYVLAARPADGPGD
jgi:hypothetical protein